MGYLVRNMERKFTRLNDFFQALLITGARQVGKTTMLKHLAEGQNRTYVTLDDFPARNLAKSDPALFLQTYKPPILIDEVQYAPELFPQIKIMCDESGETGLFWLTGSQSYNMMKNVRESLAGRVGILELYSLSKAEKDGVKFDREQDFSLDCLQERAKQAKPTDVTEVFSHIWHGGMPRLLQADAEQRREYFESYVSTYLMRDAAELGGITDTLRFAKFLSACAALTAEQVNYKTLSDIAEISQPTAKEWLRLLEGMGIVYLLRPYYNNALKRLTKTPKLYFLDTGLCAHLTMWPTPETLMAGAASGHIFENFVVTELLKNNSVAPEKAAFSYYRDANGKEIDLLVEQGGQIHPLEIKKSANPNTREVKKFEVLDKAVTRRGTGGIVCLCERPVAIDGLNCFMPVGLL